ncbi:MAG: Asp-tRNA(Asn)/Glu-tRNA(Gln) amidotransferase subunit GatC [bacterium]|nr:Asp-tRNA(Asn)/Glu-tRNA(Gln) amidotransferase subunit GatC [bacterium]
MITTEEIEKLAMLARIALSPEEKERMRGEVDSILEYVATIQKVSATAGTRTPSIVAQVNVMREDGSPHESGIYTEALVSSAPRREGNYIKVKKIL